MNTTKNDFSQSTLPFRNAVINTAKIRIQEEYQRRLNKARVSKIADKWNWMLFNEPKLSKRDDGSLWCFDGQHTIAAAKKLNGGKDVEIPCLVYDGLTPRDEAWLFTHQQDEHQKVNASDTYRSSLYAEEANTVAIAKICEVLGLKVTKSSGKNCVTCIAALNRIYTADGPEVLGEVLSLNVHTWNGDEGALCSKLVTGVRDFVIYCRDNGQNYDRDRFISKCGSNPASLILRNSQGITSNHKVRDQLLNEYNKGLRNKL